MARPDRVYLTIAATAAFVSATAFTIAPLYRIRTAELGNLQLVLVGTFMEAAVLLFEIPTGVVADRWSRKWSVITGHAGMGVGFLIEAAVPTFAGILVGQVVWGIAYTFTSGATVAWVSGELGDPDRAVLARLFMRGSRIGSATALVAVPLSFAIGINISLPRPADRRRLPVDRSRGLAGLTDGRGAVRAGPIHGALDLAEDGSFRHGRCAGDPGEPCAHLPHRRDLPRRGVERGVRPLCPEVPARARAARVDARGPT